MLEGLCKKCFCDGSCVMTTPNIPQNIGNPIHNGGFITIPRMAEVTAGVGVPPTWRGNSMQPHRVFPRIAGYVWHGFKQGTFDLEQQVPPLDPRFPRGSRMTGRKGTIDCRLTQGTVGAGVREFLFLSTKDDSFVATFSISTTGGVEGELTDAGGTTVAAFSTTQTAAEGEQIHFQFGWDSTTGEVAATFNGEAVVTGDYTTTPSGPWTPWVPQKVQLVLCQVAIQFDGVHELTQLSNEKVI